MLGEKFKESDMYVGMTPLKFRCSWIHLWKQKILDTVRQSDDAAPSRPHSHTPLTQP